MPRRARFLEDHAYYHVLSRSTNQTWIFRDPADFGKCRALLLEAKRMFPIKLFHYAIMSTHFHLVIQVEQKEWLARHLAHVKWGYTYWMRQKYRWRGPLWRERFKSLPIRNEEYLTACGRYVELNPVHAGICTDPAAYPYSSASKYVRGTPDPLVDDYSPHPLSPEVNAWLHGPHLATAYTPPNVLFEPFHRGDSHLGDKGGVYCRG